MSLRLARVCAEQFPGNEIRTGAQGPGQKMFSIDPVIHGAFSLQIISHACPTWPNNFDQLSYTPKLLTVMCA